MTDPATEFPTLRVSSHPAILHKLALLRDQTTKPPQFRQLVREISWLLGYEALADETAGVTFVGRLATYRYYNMDQIVGQALATFRRMSSKRPQETAVAAE